MKIFRMFVAPGLLAAGALFAGCEVDTPNQVQRNVGVDFTGFYSRTSGSNVAAIVSNNSGAPITSLDLRQGGDRLEAIDSNGIVFKGSIGSFNGTTASFELVGKTTAGNQGTISGTLSASGSNTTGAASGTMQGTWIENSLFATVFATASIPGVISGGGGGGGGSLSIVPQTISVALNASQIFTISNSSGSLRAVSRNGRGTVTVNGTSITYIRTALGQDFLDVSDSSNSASATIN
jgi:hypothetical protein